MELFGSDGWNPVFRTALTKQPARWYFELVLPEMMKVLPDRPVILQLKLYPVFKIPALKWKMRFFPPYVLQPMV